MSVLALGTAFLLAMDAQRAVALFRTHAAALHRLAARRIRQFSRDLDVQLQKALKRHVRRKRLYTLRNRKSRVTAQPPWNDQLKNRIRRRGSRSVVDDEAASRNGDLAGRRALVAVRDTIESGG